MGKKYVTPEGTRDLVLGECEIKRKLQNNIENILDKWGYKEVVTPTIEFYQTFNSGFQNLKEEEVYKFFDGKGRILVLRPDMTIPIARVVATKFKDAENPLRFRYSADVFRVHQSLGGRKNEYTDCGVELIGAEGEASDIEILVTSLEVLKALKKDGIKLEISDIRFFDTAIEKLNLDEEDRYTLGQLIDKKSVRELEDFLDNLNVEEKYKEFFMQLPWLFGGKEVLEKAKNSSLGNELKESIEYLEKLTATLEELGYGDYISFDLGMAQRLNYYTGITFRGYVEGVGAIALSGGRYDSLLKTFGTDKPAVGFSINLDSVLDILINDYKNEENGFKLYYSRKNTVEAFETANNLRNEGNVVEMIYDDKVNEVKLQKVGLKK